MEAYGLFSQHAGLSWYCQESPDIDYQAAVYVPNGSDNGYTYGVTSGEQAFFSAYASPVEISLDGGGLWAMESVWVNAAWNDGMTFSFQGLRDGQVVAEMEHVHAYATVVELIMFGNAFIGIDTLFVDSWGGTNAGFGGSGEYFTMDDFNLLRSRPWRDCTSGPRRPRWPAPTSSNRVTSTPPICKRNTVN